MKFRDLKLGVKQWLAFGAVLLIMGAVSFVSIFQMDKLRAEIDRINSYWIPSISAVSEINLNVSNLRIYQLEQALSGLKQDELITRKRVVPLFDSIEANQTAYEHLKSSRMEPAEDHSSDPYYESFESHWDDFQLQYMNLFFSESEDEAEALLSEAGTHYDALSENLKEIIYINREGSADAALRARENFEHTRGFIIFMFVGTLVISSVLAATLIQSMTTPIKKLEEAARTVAGGNLEIHIPVDSRDEIGKLARSFNDMTASLSRAQQQLLMKEKMASLGQLTAGIAHEIKNPLNFVNNFSMLTTELVDEINAELEKNKDRRLGDVVSQISELLDSLKLNAGKIELHGKRADSIVRSMLLHSGGRPDERKEVDLNKVLDEYIDLAYHSMRANQSQINISIVREFDPAMGLVYVVPQDLGRVFINLLNNAFHAVSERVSSEDNFAPEVSVKTKRKGNRVSIVFSDNGVGIGKNELQKIFEPFYTTKPTGQGTGLGLSLSYDIVTQGHGGSLTAESEKGKGATFTIILPA